MELLTMDEAQKLDQILLYLVQKNASITREGIQKNVFPDSSISECHELFNRLAKYSTIIRLEGISGGRKIISFTAETKNFLLQGGFKKEAEISAPKIAEFAQQEYEKKETVRLSLEKLRYETKMVKWKYRTYWFVAIAGIIGFLLSIYNTFHNK